MEPSIADEVTTGVTLELGVVAGGRPVSCGCGSVVNNNDINNNDVVVVGRSHGKQPQHENLAEGGEL